MSENVTVTNSDQVVNTKFEVDIKMEKLKEELRQKFTEYQKFMKILAGDCPIEALCLTPATNTILRRNGCCRIYDLFDLDFVEIKGLGEVRIRELTTKLDEFVFMF